MSITEKELAKIAELAQLAINDTQRQQLQADLNNIITLVEKLNELDVSCVEPLAHTLDATQPLREDHITEINQRDLFQSIAPYTHSGLYLVPKVLETA